MTEDLRESQWRAEEKPLALSMRAAQIRGVSSRSKAGNELLAYKHQVKSSTPRTRDLVGLLLLPQGRTHLQETGHTVMDDEPDEVLAFVCLDRSVNRGNRRGRQLALQTHHHRMIPECYRSTRSQQVQYRIYRVFSATDAQDAVCGVLVVSVVLLQNSSTHTYATDMFAIFLRHMYD
jgi:hypothetical protein